MNGTEFTKGEWKIRDGGLGTITCVHCGEIHIAQLAYCDYHNKEEENNCYQLQLANARLIAAAPDLLAACKKDAFLTDIAISATPTGETRNKLTEINILRLQAIAKAEKQG